MDLEQCGTNSRKLNEAVPQGLSGRVLDGECCLEESWDLEWQDLEVWRVM